MLECCFLESAEAVSVTTVPVAKLATQDDGQDIPSGTLLTDPVPATVTVKVRVDPETNSYAPESHAPVPGRALLVLAGQTDWTTPPTVCSVQAEVVSFVLNPEGQNVEVRLLPVFTVSWHDTLGAYG